MKLIILTVYVIQPPHLYFLLHLMAQLLETFENKHVEEAAPLDWTAS